MSAIDDLPPLRDVIREHSLSARKSLGQNFLLDLNLTARIARAAGPLEGVTVIEIGPGPGGLTRALLALGAKRVIAVERDERALAPLDYISKRYPGRLEIVHADAQRFDPRPMLGGEPARIVANLPYNIATALLVDWLSIEPWPPWYDMMVLMFQREVAERIVARENDEAYGRLAVLANWRAETKILFDISPAAFVPQPKVTSSVVRLVPRNEPEPCDRRALEQVAAAAFGQRRKMLRQSLKSLSVDPARLAAAAEVDATRRAETIPVSGFVAMARELTDIRNTKSQSPKKIVPRRKCHGADASPVSGQIRCAVVRNHCRHAEAARPRSPRPHRALRALSFRSAHPGRLCRSRRRQAARHHARHDAAVYAGTRDRRRRRRSRPRCSEGADRKEAGGIPLDRLRPVPRLRQRR